MNEPNVIWTPQAGPQTAFIRCPYKEVLYGGAAGGGKSDALLGDFASGIEQYGDAWKGILIRRSFPQLEELESRALQIFGPHYGVDSYKSGKKTWYLPSANNGVAELRLRAIEEDKDALKHIGHQFSWIGFDELTLFPSDYVMNYLMTRLRSPKGAPTYVRCTTNPGSVGHSWVKARWRIPDDPNHPVGSDIRPMEPFDVTNENGEVLHQRIFIPAKLTDNKILMENDPGYEYMLDGIDDPVLRRALRDGDWSITQGAAFPEFNPAVHVVNNHDVPDGVPVWRSLDWGYSKPFSCLWFYARPDGGVNVCGEWYGCGGKHNVGIQMDPEQVAERIKTVEQINGWDVKEAYLDPACWAQHGGPSIFEQLGGFKMGWMPWSKEHNWRRNKKQLLHGYLRVINGVSRLTIQRKCTDLVRTMIPLPLDQNDPEVVDKRAEDHAYDSLCGGLSKNVPTKDQMVKRNMLDWLDSRSGGKKDYTFGGW